MDSTGNLRIPAQHFSFLYHILMVHGDENIWLLYTDTIRAWRNSYEIVVIFYSEIHLHSFNLNDWKLGSYIIISEVHFLCIFTDFLNLNHDQCTMLITLFHCNLKIYFKRDWTMLNSNYAGALHAASTQKTSSTRKTC